jgi:hypothetical protein
MGIKHLLRTRALCNLRNGLVTDSAVRAAPHSLPPVIWSTHFTPCAVEMIPQHPGGNASLVSIITKKYLVKRLEICKLDSYNYW